MSPLTVTERDGCVRFGVRVQPRAKEDAISGLHGDSLKVRLKAPPVEGAANEALVAFLAEAFGVPKRSVRIHSGASGRTKVVEVDGVRAPAVRALVGEALAIRSSG